MTEQHCHRPGIWPRTSFFNTLRLSFLICKKADTCFLVSLRELKSRCKSTRCGDWHNRGAQSRLFFWRKTKFPLRLKRQFSLLRPKAGPYSVTGFITFTTYPSSRTPTPTSPVPHSTPYPQLGTFSDSGKEPNSTRLLWDTAALWRLLDMGA